MTPWRGSRWSCASSRRARHRLPRRVWSGARVRGGAGRLTSATSGGVTGVSDIDFGAELPVVRTPEEVDALLAEMSRRRRRQRGRAWCRRRLQAEAEPTYSGITWQRLSEVEMRSIKFVDKPLLQGDAFHVSSLAARGWARERARRGRGAGHRGELGQKRNVVWIGSEDSPVDRHQAADRGDGGRSRAGAGREDRLGPVAARHREDQPGDHGFRRRRDARDRPGREPHRWRRTATRRRTSGTRSRR